MVFSNNLLMGAAAAAGAAPAAGWVPKGAIWLDGTADYLSKTPGVAGNRKTWTFSAWVKRSQISESTNNRIFDAGTSSVEYLLFGSGGSAGTDQIEVTGVDGSGSTCLETTSVYRDPSAWMHVVLVIDTANAISSDRANLFVNGRQLTDFDTNTAPSLNDESHVNNTVQHTIGVNGYNTTSQFFNGYMSEIILLDGYAGLPSDFGTEDSNGVWIPKDPTTVVTDNKGTCGFWLDFADSADLGNDVSGNGNDWALQGNLAATNWSYDRPANSGSSTGNFATLDPLDVDAYTAGIGTLSNGNLKHYFASAADTRGAATTISTKSGKWYWEITYTTLKTAYPVVGILKTGTSGTTSNANVAVNNPYSGNFWNFGSLISTGWSAYSSGDVVMFALDQDNGALYVGRDGTWETVSSVVGIPDSGASKTGAVSTDTALSDGTFLCPVVMDSDGSITTCNFGGSTFSYPIGASNDTEGFAALGTQNLPAPTVTKPTDNFLPILYEGNGTGQRVGNFIPFTDSKTVDNSCRFDNGGSDYLTKTFTATSSGNTKCTISFWHKRGSNVNELFINAGDTASTGSTWLQIGSTSESYGFRIVSERNGEPAPDIDMSTERRIRDTSAWHNYVVEIDTTSAVTAVADKCKIYIDGVRVTEFTSFNSGPVYPALDDTVFLGNDDQHNIGASLGSGNYVDGYISEFVLINGTAYSASSFGETDTSTNRWIPKDVSGLTFGTNGFYLPMTAGNQLGMDNKGGSNTEEDALEVFLCSFDGADGATTATDASSYGTTMTFTSGAALSNAQSKWGTTSLLLDGTNDFVALSPEYLLIGPNTNFTFEAWIYLNSNSATMDLFALRSGAGNYYQLGLHFAQSIGARFADGSGGVDFNQGSNSGWSTGQWYHIAYVKNGTAYAIYRDGTSIASTTDSHTWDLYGLAAATVGIGTADAAWGNFFDGYVSDARISMKAVYTANFTAPTGAFSAPTAANNFLPYNVDKINDSNQMYDTPTRNYNVMDGTFLGASWGTTLASGLTQGNLKFTRSSGDAVGSAFMGAGSGKWYVEIVMDTVVTSNSNMSFGIVDLNNSIANNNFATGTNSYAYRNYTGTSTSPTTGQKMPRATTVTAGTGYAAGDVLGIAFDLDAGYMWAAKNNTWFDDADGSAGNPTAGTFPLLTGIAPSGPSNPAKWAISLYFNDSHAATFNFGQWRYFDGGATTLDTTADGYFKYTPPTDFLAFQQDNLSENTAGITGLSWIKNRDTTDFHIWFDRARGIYNYLRTSNSVSGAPYDGYSVEATNANGVQRFLQQGVQVGNMNEVNTSAESYALWNWANDGASTGIAIDEYSVGVPTLASTVRANTEAGFSIVTYSGDGDATTKVGHGLGVKPDFIVLKGRTYNSGTAGWYTYHSSIGATASLWLDQSSVKVTDSGYWADIEPTDQVWSMANNGGMNQISSTFVAYCWASIDGYSKFGSYIGNGEADGRCVNVGFTPSWLLIKRSDATGAWQMYDNVRGPLNPNSTLLYPNEDAADAADTANAVDLLSNGFKCRGVGTNTNADQASYVYAAFAENPFGGSGVGQAKAI